MAAANLDVDDFKSDFFVLAQDALFDSCPDGYCYDCEYVDICGCYNIESFRGNSRVACVNQSD